MFKSLLEKWEVDGVPKELVRTELEKSAKHAEEAIAHWAMDKIKRLVEENEYADIVPILRAHGKNSPQVAHGVSTHVP
jgi:hypothetical protein